MKSLTDEIKLGELLPDDYIKAYGLAVLAHDAEPETVWIASIREWQQCQSPERGIIGVKNTYGYLIALVFYEVTATPDLGRLLKITELTIPTMFKGLISTHFLPLLDNLAGRLECWTIHVPSKQFKYAPFLRSQEGFDCNANGLYRYLPYPSHHT